MSEIKPFKIEIADEDINKLRSRIESTRWPEKETVNDWNQGTPLSYMKEVSEYWINNYNWREREKYYNSCLLYTSPSPRDLSTSRMPSSA